MVAFDDILLVKSSWDGVTREIHERASKRVVDALGSLVAVPEFVALADDCEGQMPRYKKAEAKAEAEVKRLTGVLAKTEAAHKAAQANLRKMPDVGGARHEAEKVAELAARARSRAQADLKIAQHEHGRAKRQHENAVRFAADMRVVRVDDLGFLRLLLGDLLG